MKRTPISLKKLDSSTTTRQEETKLTTQETKLEFLNKKYEELTNEEKKLYIRYNIIPPMITCPECLNRKLQEQIYEFQFLVREYQLGNTPQELNYGEMMTLVGLHDECCRRRVMGLPDVPIGYAITNTSRYDERLDPLQNITTIRSNVKLKTKMLADKVKPNPVVKGGRVPKIKKLPLSVISVNKHSSIYSDYDQSKLGEYSHSLDTVEAPEIRIDDEENPYIKQMNSHIMNKRDVKLETKNDNVEDREVFDLLEIAKGFM